MLFAIYRAVKSEIGVSTTTISVITGEIVSIKISVTAIVITPVKSCEKPKISPSANCSASAITRLTISP